MHRRLRLAIITLVSQMLLIALAISWFVHMVLIKVYGSVYFVDTVPAILWAEIIATVVITMFGFLVLVQQIRHFGEGRGSDRGSSG